MNTQHLFISFIRSIGLIDFVLFLFRKKISIIVLHGVMDSDTTSVWAPTWNRYPPRALEQVLSRLSRRFNFLSLDEVVGVIYGEKNIKPNAVAFTFDDGYSNNFTHAWPIIKKYNASMTVYLATKYINERKAFWVDEIDYALSFLVGSRDIKVNFDGDSYIFDLSSREKYVKSYADFRTQLKSKTFSSDYEMLKTFEDVAVQLQDISGMDLQNIFEEDPWTRTVSRKELENLDRNINVGAHTINHVRVTKVDSESLKAELNEAKLEIEMITKKKCDHFCYPSGDYSLESAKKVEKAGYRSAVTSDMGTNNIGCNPYFLKRISLPHMMYPGDIDYWLAKVFVREFFKLN